MTDESANPGGPAAGAASAPGLPAAVDRAIFQAELDVLRVREKAHTREGDAIAAARRRLPLVEVDASLMLTGPRRPLTLLDAFEGRRQLIAYYFMWWAGHLAAEQCEGCTWVATQVAELSYLHSRDITYAVFCQGPYDQSSRYRDFMGWDMPWYSAQASLDALLAGRQIGLFHLVCYLRDGDRVFETYWTKRRGAEAMDYSYAHDSAAARPKANELALLKLMTDQPAVGENLPLVTAQNATATGADLEGYFSEGHGVSTFARESDTVYHCYSSYARGTEFLMGYYAILDRAPKGRGEGDQPMSWLRRHDEYHNQ